ncbi:hypothetical protein [Staphylococcus sp. 17KM0847]|uniref:hypothetical protein n=1 Tax=Staphylococcus sp. 17KM0847 TaxID=2583989 RepID=UPI0015DC673A|nr:hypothetical protein [Staphylococcus sp. 17KM0847]QLK85561.1 hypothetical protein FGL66_01990 [Staphylococcus sp. 17KM0847]
MLEDEGDIKLLYQAIQELNSSVGLNRNGTNTVSLIFVEMDLRYSVFEEIQSAFLKYLAHRNIDKIKYLDLIDIINNTLPKDRELSYVILNKIIIGFAHHYYPELQQIANRIISEEGHTIYKYFNPNNIDN